MKKKESKSTPSAILLGIVAALLILAVAGLIWKVSFSERPSFPRVRSVRETGVSLGEFPLRVYALAPDGQAMYDASLRLRDWDTGNVLSNPLEDMPTALNISMVLSPDGQYMAGWTEIWRRPTNEVEDRRSIVDMDNRSVWEYIDEERDMGFGSWSPDSSRIMLMDEVTLLTYPEVTILTGWPHDVDFRDVSNVAGDHNYLWDVERNIPIARTYIQEEQNEQGELITRQFGIQSLHDPNASGDPLFVPYYDLGTASVAVEATFDPTGRYVLAAVLEFSEPLAIGDHFFENPIDTALVLIDWRTGEHVEFFRLSSLDQQNAIVSHRGLDALQWSADGSTIVVPREDAPALLLEVEYP